MIKLVYFSCRDHYISMEKLPSGNGYADIACLPKRGTDLPALLIELKRNQTADTAIRQIKERHYPDVLEEYTDNILLVGISYGRNDPKKCHHCRIERYAKES